MATVSRGLPERPHLEVPKREARNLLAALRDRSPEALERIQKRHPKFKNADPDTIASTTKLADAQIVIAREYGLASWAALKQRIAGHGAAGALQDAIGTGNREAVIAILRDHPEMLHLPVWSGNWGPPMSHAANLGQLEIIKTCAELGARDFQHAFERAILQGQLACARWLHAHGAKVVPGIVMGPCETLEASGLEFLLELGAPLSNEQGDRLAPLAAVLGTYTRNPAGKHAILEQLQQRACALPDTPVMALHRGDLRSLERHLARDPRLLERTFALREIYPAECGFVGKHESGLHWTPIDGTTLLHLAIDFREKDIIAWLLDRGANVNARAAIDLEGFGGHTPLFNAVVNGPWPDAETVPALLARGADPEQRASLRKFIDWREQPGWHIARIVTAAEWSRGFPERNFVTPGALEKLS